MYRDWPSFEPFPEKPDSIGLSGLSSVFGWYPDWLWSVTLPTLSIAFPLHFPPPSPILYPQTHKPTNPPTRTLLMLELNITDFFKTENPCDYSDSIAHSGQQNIGQITYNNALNSDYDFISPLSDTETQELRDFFLSSGAWEKEEISNWSAQELNALLIQFISGDLQEQTDKNGNIYAENNSIANTIFQDENGGVWYSFGM